MKIAKAKASWLKEEGQRLDAGYHLGLGHQAKIAVESCPHGFTTMSGVTHRIFYGGRARRYYVNSLEYGTPFISSSGMMKADLNTAKIVSNKYTKDLDSTLITDSGWTLISRSGTVGNVAYSNADFLGKAATEDIIRVVPNEEIFSGYLYAFLSSRYGYGLLTQGTFGAVIQHIEPDFIAKLPVPRLPSVQMQEIHENIEAAAHLREEATRLLAEADKTLMEACQLSALTRLDYEYFGAHVKGRPLSAFTVRSLKPTSLAAFNYSARVTQLRDRVAASVPTRPLSECLTGRSTFSTGSFKRFELDSPSSIELINQSDIFANRIQGKMLARHYISNQRLVEYGEVLIAGVGTLGENETFCRALFAGQDLVGKLISGEFIRMKADPKVMPAGYLYAWLASDYGFRLLRATQGGTKLCRPIPRLLADIPVPILAKAEMEHIAALVEKAQTNRYRALQLENQAINTVETAISAWQK